MRFGWQHGIHGQKHQLFNPSFFDTCYRDAWITGYESGMYRAKPDLYELKKAMRDLYEN